MINRQTRKERIHHGVTEVTEAGPDHCIKTSCSRCLRGAISGYGERSAGDHSAWTGDPVAAAERRLSLATEPLTETLSHGVNLKKGRSLGTLRFPVSVSPCLRAIPVLLSNVGDDVAHKAGSPRRTRRARSPGLASRYLHEMRAGHRLPG